MGIYAITGGSSGIGACTAELLKEKGHQVINIDVKGGDINVNLATKEGRKEAVDKLHEMCPDGLDAMLCIAGVSAMCKNAQLIVSVNYFGSVEVAEGVFDLLKKKRGSCVLTSSNSIVHGETRMDMVRLLNDTPDEDRILALIHSMEEEGVDVNSVQGAEGFYAATKHAVAQWARRVSTTWAAQGVRINALAPGNVQTPMVAALGPAERVIVDALPVPTNYGTGLLMDPIDIANAMVFLASPEAHGINGIVLFVDGGTDALLHTDRVY